MFHLQNLEIYYEEIQKQEDLGHMTCVFLAQEPAKSP